ncbi:MAG: hypothetical protein NTY22_03435 [Proteobacteria bacterium]|nr:hypothetical protein [Pseudomonadota bacterium]
MKHSAIKWIGTIIVIVIGLYVALTLTYKWKITEEKAYRLSIPEHSFTLKDGRQLRLTISIVFKNNNDAEDTAKRKQEITELLVTIFKNTESNIFGSSYDIEVEKAKLLMELKKAGFPAEYISFDTYPRLF